jgi:hypothetical protein
MGGSCQLIWTSCDQRMTSRWLLALTYSRGKMRALEPFFEWLESTLWYEIGVIEDADSTSSEKEQAVEWLAWRLQRRWRVVDVDVRRELARRAEAQGTTRTRIKVDVLKTAVWTKRTH